MEEVSLSADLTREQACQMAFNTLNADTVRYANKGTNITLSDGTTVVIGATPATTVEVNGANVNYNGAAVTDHDYDTQQFAEKYVSQLKMVNKTDKYQSSANQWSFKGVTIGSYAGAATIVYTDEMEDADVQADLEDYNNYNDASAKVKLYKNGHAETDMTVTAAAVADLTGNGTIVEIYVTDNGMTKIVVKEAVVGKVTAVSAKNETISIATEASAAGTFGASATALTTDKGYGTFEKDDMVLVYAYNTTSNSVASATVTDVVALTTVEGIASVKNTAKDTITVDGTPYTAAEAIASAYNVDSFGVSSKYDATLYLDPYGYIVYAESGTAVNNDKAVLVLKAYNGLNEDGAVVPMIKGVTSNGEVVTWETDQSYSSAAGNGLVRKYNETDGVYDLITFGSTISKTAGKIDDAQTVLVSSATINENDKTITVDSEKLYFKSDVKFIFSNSDKYTVRDGVQEVNSADIWVVIDVVNDVPYVSTVFVKAAAGNTTTSENDIVFVDASSKTANGYSLTDKDGKVQTYDTYDAYIAGEKLDLFYTKDNVTTDGFYAVSYTHLTLPTTERV